MENAESLKRLRVQTELFIDLDSTEVVLTPRATASVGPGGGRVYGPSSADRRPQKAKLIHQGGKGISTGSGGEDRKYEYVIVLAHDGEIEIGDSFSVSGNKFVVFSMDPDNGYERKAYARQHSAYPTDG